MAKQILVSLKRSDRIGQVLPYVEQIAHPGMKVVFLIHCGFNALRDLLDQLVAINAGVSSTHLPGKTSKVSWMSRQDAVKEAVLSACGALINRGIEIRVNVYAGRLERVMRDYIANQDIHLMMLGPRGSDWLRALARKMGLLAPILKIPVFSPILLLRTGHTLER